MSSLKQIQVLIRTESAARLLDALREAGVTRCWVSHVHSIGAGVDPEDFRLSLEEGSTYTEKARIELLAEAGEVDGLIELVRQHCSTGHRGDGIAVVSGVEDVVSVRTGDRDRLALL